MHISMNNGEIPKNMLIWLMKSSHYTNKHSDAQIDIAISEAFKSLQVTSEEVGIDVYEKLFRQHFYENL